MGKFIKWVLRAVIGIFLLLMGLALLFSEGDRLAGLFIFIVGFCCLPFWKKESLNMAGHRELAARRHQGETLRDFATRLRHEDRAVKTAARWIGRDETISLGGKTITGGYLYLGEFLSSAISTGQTWYAGTPDPALINPKLEVAKGNPDTAGQQMSYWPSYSSIEPASRLAYIEWLADGKKNPNAFIGYVFLYFYGLERRIVVDLPPDNEILDLSEEIRRLRSIYAHNRSFDRYSSNLLGAASFILKIRHTKNLSAIQPDLDFPSNEKASTQLLALAYQLQKGEPLSFEWSMIGYFYVARGGVVTKTVKRAFPQFVSLMRKRFEKKYPNGMKMRKRSAPYSFYYRGASQHLNLDLAKQVFLPDLYSPDSANWQKLVELGERVESELSSYAKAVGRNPDHAGSLETLLLLPADLASDKIERISTTLIPWLTKIASPVGAVAIESLVEIVTKDKPENFDQKKLRSIASVLEKFGYGLEPDPDFCRARVKLGEKVILFDARSLKDLRQIPSNAYKLAMPLATVLAGVGGSSAGGLGEEEKRWVGWIQKTLNLSEVESRRLRAHLEWLETQKLTAAKIKGAISEIPEAQRGTIAHFAAAVAYADGIIEKSEVAFLEKIYDELGIERKQLYATLHDMGIERSVAATEPVTVEVAAATSAGYKIQPPPKILKTKKNDKRSLDHAKIDQILADTKQVSAILADIFKEEEVPASASNSNSSNAEGSFSGLDANHAALAMKLAEQREWEHEEFEKMAKHYNLMPNGALEVINEWAFEKFDELLIEDGNKIEINLDLVG